MVDSGASHNFISYTLVSKLKLPVKGTTAFKVTVGDGHMVKGKGMCKEGDASLAKTEVSYRTVLKSISRGGQGFLLELGKIEANTEAEHEKSEVSGEVQQLLDDYKIVCEPLKGLPPKRTRDHAIMVKDGAVPPNIRPYRQMLSNRAQKSSVYERELMAIVFAVKKWRHYLLGHKVVIRTDKKALKYLLEQLIIDPDQQKWASKLMGYNFEIQYKPGVENKAADALSGKGGNTRTQGFFCLAI
ncbi:putative mitochondrial protein [Senna tora]|uniref:Putative mitochondrial protein n=1 Tax=Senna tora TaxID=362788 RepID=A0A834SZN3_9FABA|nr:putative mitochondrial protein [Senna tora]